MKIVFLHGLGQDVSAWNKVIASLGNIDHQSLELFDNGRLPNSYQLLEEKVRQDVTNISDDIILVGLSLGGSLAYSLLENLPKNVKGLVICAGQYKVKGNPIYHIQKAIFKLFPKVVFKKQGFDKDNMLTFYNTMADFDTETSLKTSQIPCRIVCGSKDKPNLKSAREAAQLISNATYHEITGAGHLLTDEAPQELASLIKEFYGELVT